MILLNALGCLTTYASADLETQKRETREKINRLKWLESLETNKLYKNQQKLERATSTLSTSKSQIVSAQKELYDLEVKLSKASFEYNALNYTLARHLRSVYKSQRKDFFEILLNSEDINMLGDRLHYQQIILKDDYGIKLNFEFIKFVLRKAYRKTQIELKNLMDINSLRFYNYSKNRTYVEKPTWESWDTNYLVSHLIIFLLTIFYGRLLCVIELIFLMMELTLMDINYNQILELFKMNWRRQLVI